MEGPIVNGAYNSAMPAIAFENHCCVSDVGEDTIWVYRNKLFTISSNIKTTTEEIRVSYQTTLFLLEMKEFILFHLQKALEKGSLLQEQLDRHTKAIDVIDNTLNSRTDSKKEVEIFLLKRLIEKKEVELELLKSQLDIMINNLKINLK